MTEGYIFRLTTLQNFITFLQSAEDQDRKEKRQHSLRWDFESL